MSSLRVEEVHNLSERGDVLVLPDADVVRGDAAFGQDGSGFGEDEASASDGAAAQVDEMPIVGEAVMARVLTHRRDGDAVGERQGTEGDRREQMRHEYEIRRTVLWMRLCKPASAANVG